MTNQNDIIFIQNMNYEKMLEIWRNIPPEHKYFTDPVLWGEFETRRKHLMNTLSPIERNKIDKKVGHDGPYT